MHVGPIVRAMNHNRTRVVLIVVEIAITLAIVTNCVNVILAERAKMLQTSGFDDDNILLVRMRPFAPEYRESGFVDTTIDRDLRTIGSIPGVKAVANTHFQPWEGGGSGSGVFVPGTGNPPVVVQSYYTTKDIVPALGGTIIEGRGFNEGDHLVGPGTDPVDTVIISKSVADLLFPGENAVGRQISEGEPDAPSIETLTVVGVLEDFYNPFGRATSLAAHSDRAIFLPARNGSYYGIRYLIRTEPGAMKSVTAEVEKRLTGLDSGRVFEFQALKEKKGNWFANSKIVVSTMTFIIVALVAVTALGLLGLTSLSVAERTRQIGTRRALGATRGHIARHFILENSILTSVGLLLGIGGAYALNFLLVSHVSDVKLEWELVAGGVVLLCINSLLATLPPALRATLIPPSIATRSV